MRITRLVSTVGFGATLIVASAARAQTPRRPLTVEVGRFEVKTVEYESYASSDGISAPTIKKMLIKIDTVTGKLWQYRSFGLVTNKKLVMSQHAWVPMADEPEDIEVKLRRSSAAPKPEAAALNEDSIQRAFKKVCKRGAGEREVGYMLGAAASEPLTESDVENILTLNSGTCARK